jgi:hypothetical protein
MRIPPIALQAQNCPTLPPLQGERLVLYSTYEGAALSTSSVGDPNKETTLADVVVEKGKGRLYVLLSSSDAVIWRFTGDVNRVTKVYVSTGQKIEPDAPAAGVVGIDRQKVTFGACLRAFDAVESIEGARSRGDLRKNLGREPDYVGAHYATAVVSIPSMTQLKAPPEQTKTPVGFDQNIWRDVLLFWPAGLARVSPGSIVSPTKSIAYDVLPSQGGLAQLTGSGALRRLSGSNEYKIVRPIPRFPAGMGGAHSAKFLLGRGIPMPAGDPVHSCVVSEETGEVLSRLISCGS